MFKITSEDYLELSTTVIDQEAVFQNKNKENKNENKNENENENDFKVRLCVGTGTSQRKFLNLVECESIGDDNISAKGFGKHSRSHKPEEHTLGMPLLLTYDKMNGRLIEKIGQVEVEVENSSSKSKMPKIK